MNDDLSLGRLVEDKIWIRLCRNPPNGGSSVIAPASGLLNSRSVTARIRLWMRGSLRGMIGDVVQNRFKVGKSRKRIPQPHRPCLVQTARTCSSVANSPRSAAALERAIASRSSGERTIGAWRSTPASCIMARAMSSWSSEGNRRTASSASSRSFVISTMYGRDGLKSRTGLAGRWIAGCCRHRLTHLVSLQTVG
jgi:hypothetical protein